MQWSNHIHGTAIPLANASHYAYFACDFVSAKAMNNKECPAEHVFSVLFAETPCVSFRINLLTSLANCNNGRIY